MNLVHTLVGFLVAICVFWLGAGDTHSQAAAESKSPDSATAAQSQSSTRREPLGVPLCQLVDTIPTEAKHIDSTVITANPGSSSWTKTFTAGQAAYVTLKNGAPPHITAVKLRFFEKTPGGERDACVSQVMVLPMKPITLSHSVFAESVTYNLEVSLAQDPDVALVQVEVKALPKQ